MSDPVPIIVCLHENVQIVPQVIQVAPGTTVAVIQFQCPKCKRTWDVLKTTLGEPAPAAG